MLSVLSISQRLLLASAFFLVACKASPKKEAATLHATTAADLKRMDTLSRETVKMGERTDSLKKLQPLTVEKLKALLPAALNEYRKTTVENTTADSAVSVIAVYQKMPGVEMLLSVQDCAGESGAELYSLRYWNALNVTEENEDGYLKTILLNGGKAIEEHKKAEKETTLTWFAAERFLVSLKAKGLSAAVLRQAAQGLDFK